MLKWSERSPAFIISVRVSGKHGGGVTSAVFSGNTETSGEFINNNAILKTYHNAQSVRVTLSNLFSEDAQL